MNHQEFEEFTKDRIVILDGATATCLMDAGMPRDACFEEWAVDHPGAVTRLQEEYVRAGSCVLYAPTFGANPINLRHRKMADRTERINTEAVKLSRKVSADALVCGNMSLCVEDLKPYGELEFEELADCYAEQISYLDAAGCDLIAAETIMDLNQARALLSAAQKTTKLPVMITMTFNENGKTSYGQDPATVAKTLADCGASAVGANCSYGPEQILPIIETMAASVKLPIAAKPNAGTPLPSLGKGTKYAIDPGSFAIMMTRIIDAGANLVGGCCGTSPEYIKQMALLCENMTFTSAK